MYPKLVIIITVQKKEKKEIKENTLPTMEAMILQK
jgi:hypothetical protein